ncbi:MAG: ChbG/HpnK family deacetylase, partial [Candidatus Poribacteria bacterium]|nr:ChbG/HpnK family deacetylase [Candidatus Poribacteria bacterium]
MNLAERIGFEANARLLIVHADDSGMCHGANWATAEAFRSGAISSTAVMVPCAWFESFAAECRDNPSWDVGVHITVTSEWVRYRWRPLTVAPSLVDGEGFFPRGSNEVADNAKVEEAAAEMRAQVERALE